MNLLVSDIRQYTYCPRIVYYHYCLPRIRPTTYLMRAGQEAHAAEAERERRRSLRVYHLSDGERSFEVAVEDSEGLQLRGKVDMVVERAGEVIPIEHKNSPGRLGQHVILQLVAYGMLLAQQTHKPATRGFVYYIPARRAREIALTDALKITVRQQLTAMQEMIRKESMPAPPRTRKRCTICEFRRFCNDVV